jgi:hypothetical protein
MDSYNEYNERIAAINQRHNAALEYIELRFNDFQKLQNDKNIGNKQLDNKIVNLEKLFYSECINKRHKQDIKPHKCPLCNGSGRYQLATALHASDIVDCHGCRTDGIVWG